MKSIMKRLTLSFFSFLISLIFASAQSSEAIGSVNLLGRSLNGGLPRITIAAEVDCVVVVSIYVDNYGTVQKAVAGSEGTTTNNRDIWNAARTAALRAHFNMSADAPAMQQGTITYTFKSVSLPLSDDSVIKFMGIPIDGDPAQFAKALQTKGFVSDSWSGELRGLFNGENVSIDISTNHNIVDRVIVEYPRCSEDNDTRIKYNTLLSRFGRNAKYVSLAPRNELPAGEHIYSNISSNSKYYDVVYFYLHPDVNPNTWKEDFKTAYAERYSKPIEKLSYEEMEEVLFCLPLSVSAAVNGIVWFTMVDEHEININYVNLKNRPRGEDL